MMRCASYCTADTYHVSQLMEHLKANGTEPKLYDSVIHVSHPTNDGQIFYFSYGCVIFWGLQETEEMAYLEALKAFEIKPLPNFISDCFSFSHDQETMIDEEEDKIILESTDVLIKLSLSHGFAQSVKLTVFEESTLRTIESTKHLISEMVITGKTSLSRKKMSQKISGLFSVRNTINTHCDILDTPEFFWRRPRYEPYYHMGANYMDIATRLDILNKRLDVIHELYDMFSNELKHSHSSRLEMIIILLIVMEVILSLHIFF